MHVFGEALENIWDICFIITVRRLGEAFSDEGGKTCTTVHQPFMRFNLVDRTFHDSQIIITLKR